jgi:hypothetical protein
LKQFFIHAGERGVELGHGVLELVDGLLRERVFVHLGHGFLDLAEGGLEVVLEHGADLLADALGGALEVA